MIEKKVINLKSIQEIRKLNPSEQNEFFKNKSIKDLLLYFMEEDYLEEALKIPSKNIRIIQQDSIIKKYRIIEKNYIIEINIHKKVIKHNCLYWMHKCSKRYTLCKHLGKIFSIIFEEDSKNILKDLILNDWNFEVI
ncbi:MAG: hypothetical protein ACTSWR_09110 [Candidatus Helarchaeota archaeon]